MEPDSANAGTARFRIGECSFYLGEYESAAAQLEDYVQRHPDDKLIDWGRLQLGESWVELEKWQQGDELLNDLAGSSVANDIRIRARYALARSLEKQKRADEAVSAYREVSQLPDDRMAARALARAGTIRLQQQQYADATELYDQIVTRFPESELVSSATLYAGLALYRMERYDDALSRLESIVDSSPNFAEARLISGMALAAAGRFDESRDALLTALQAAGESPLAAECLFEQAKLERLAGQQDLAARIFVDLADRWPEDVHVVDALFNAANIRIELAEGEAATRIVRRLKSDFPQAGSEPRIRVLEGRALLTLNDIESAEQILKTVIDEDSSDRRSIALARYSLARTWHAAERYADAVEMVEGLIPELDLPANSDLQGAIALAAMSALELDRFDGAESLATRYLNAISEGPQAIDALAVRAVARAGLGSYESALADTQLLIEQAPANPQTWAAILQAAERAWRQKEFSVARQFFQQTDRPFAPDSVRSSGLQSAAWCLYALEEYDDAVTAFQRVIDQLSDASAVSEARYMKVRSLHQSRDPSAAAEEYAAVAIDFLRQAADADDEEFRSRLNAWALDAGRNAAQLMAEQNQLQQADRQWSLLADHFADSEELDRILDEWAWMYLKARLFDSADVIYERLLKERPESQFAGNARLALAESLLSERRVDEALQAFRQIVDHPTFAGTEKAKALFHLIDIHAEQTNWNEVVALAKQFAREYSGDSLAPRVQLLHADALLNLQELSRAGEMLRMLRRGVIEGHLDQQPWTERIWVVLSETALEEKNYTLVDETAAEFTERFPNSQHLFQIRFAQGKRWKNQPEPDFERAREYFRKVVFDNTGRRTRTAASSQFLIAETLLLQGNLSEAVREYYKVYISYPYPDLQAAALYQAAGCQEELGEQDESRLTLRTLIGEFPRSEFAQRVRTRLEDNS